MAGRMLPPMLRAPQAVDERERCRPTTPVCEPRWLAGSPAVAVGQPACLWRAACLCALRGYRPSARADRCARFGDCVTGPLACTPLLPGRQDWVANRGVAIGHRVAHQLW